MNTNFLFSLLFFFSATASANSAKQNNDTQIEKLPIDVVANKPKIISSPSAPYPKMLLRDCVGGKVTFQFTVMLDGKVEYDVKIIESPNIELSRSVIATVRNKWLFTPYAVSSSGKLATFKSFMYFYPECHKPGLTTQSRGPP